MVVVRLAPTARRVVVYMVRVPAGDEESGGIVAMPGRPVHLEEVFFGIARGTGLEGGLLCGRGVGGNGGLDRIVDGRRRL